jgi:Rod binding domain-containing protein
MMLAGLDGANRAVAAEHGKALDPRLVRAAHEFEAQMMKELLQPMTRHAGLGGQGDGKGEGEETGVLGEFACESLAGALSAHGGLGIANQIVRVVSHSGNGSANLRVIENPQMNTGMSARK